MLACGITHNYGSNVPVGELRCGPYIDTHPKTIWPPEGWGAGGLPEYCAVAHNTRGASQDYSSILALCLAFQKYTCVYFWLATTDTLNNLCPCTTCRL